MSLRNSFEQASSSPGFGGLGEAMLPGVRHHDDHRLRLLRGDEVVEDELGVAAPAGVGARPRGVVVAAAVVQVEHRIPRLAVGLVARRQVDVHPLLFPGVVRVGRLLDLAVGDVGLGVERGVVEGGQGRQDGQLGRPRLRHRRHAAWAPAARPAGGGPSPLILRNLVLTRSGRPRGRFRVLSGYGGQTRPRPARARPSRGADAMRAWCPTPGGGLVRPRTIERVATERPLPGRNNQESWWSRGRTSGTGRDRRAHGVIERPGRAKHEELSEAERRPSSSGAAIRTKVCDGLLRIPDWQQVACSGPGCRCGFVQPPAIESSNLCRLTAGAPLPHSDEWAKVTEHYLPPTILDPSGREVVVRPFHERRSVGLSFTDRAASAKVPASEPRVLSRFVHAQEADPIDPYGSGADVGPPADPGDPRAGPRPGRSFGQFRDGAGLLARRPGDRRGRATRQVACRLRGGADRPALGPAPGGLRPRLHAIQPPLHAAVLSRLPGPARPRDSSRGA